jgi:hypothetical protein
VTKYLNNDGKNRSKLFVGVVVRHLGSGVLLRSLHPEKKNQKKFGLRSNRAISMKNVFINFLN